MREGTLDRPPKRCGPHIRKGRWRVRRTSPWTRPTGHVGNYGIDWVPDSGEIEPLTIHDKVDDDGRVDLRVRIRGKWEVAARVVLEGLRCSGWRKLALKDHAGAFRFHADHASTTALKTWLSFRGWPT